MEYIPYGTQCIEDDDIDAVVWALKSGYLTTGPAVSAFEAALAEEVGAKYAVAVSSGTAALHLAAIAAGIEHGDEVIVSPLTFAASANCVLYQGGKPVFADIDPETLLMRTEAVTEKITDKTKAIIAVHYGGELCDMDALTELAERHGLALIQDASHSLGGKIRGRKQGTYAGVQIWSFHPVKTITTGEGGAITTNDEGIYKLLLRLRTHGITRDTSSYRNGNEGGWYYEMLELGFNYRITDIQCALGVSQLKKLPRFAERRAEIVQAYNEAFETLPLALQKTPNWSKPVRHLYTIRVDHAENRKKVYDRLKAKNIGVNVHYIPVYRLPYYQTLGYSAGLCPNAEDAYSKMISLPLYPAMTDEQVCYVIQAVKDAIC